MWRIMSKSFKFSGDSRRNISKDDDFKESSVVIFEEIAKFSDDFRENISMLWIYMKNIKMLWRFSKKYLSFYCKQSKSTLL